MPAEALSSHDHERARRRQRDAADLRGGRALASEDDGGPEREDRNRVMRMAATCAVVSASPARKSD